MKKALLFVLVLVNLAGLKAQFAYYLTPNTFPIYENNLLVAQPFTGGLNAVNISKTDINLDGFKDLMVFDKTDERVHVFLYTTTNNYVYEPTYSQIFPRLKVFGLFKDYNNDGIEDIYSVVQSNAGFSVFKGDIINNTKKYQLKTSYGFPFLVGDYYPPSPPSAFANIIIGGDQIPGIYDIDNDGDLDVFHYSTVSYLGLLQSLKNMSMEKFATADSLEFIRVDACYGKFRESYINPCIPHTLYPYSIVVANNLGDSLCKLNNYLGFTNSKNGDSRIQNMDPNSSMLFFDPNHDGNADILMSDFTCDSIRYLKGANQSGYNVIQSVTTVFPNVLNPVKMQSPTAYYEDIDNDGLKDLVFSTNNVNAISKNGIWYYKNIAANASVPDTFSLVSKRFLLDQTIDVGFQSHPVLFDIDNDGDNDLFIGSGYAIDNVNNLANSSIYFYQNTGTASAPVFNLVSNDYLNLQSYGLKSLRPAFGDMDNDGDNDLIVGAADGKFYYFDNTASAGALPSYTFVANKLPSPLFDIGDFSSPVIIDIDNDGFKDIISGRSNGKLALIKQSGLNNFSIIKPWGGIQVCPIVNCTSITVPSILKFNNTNYLAVGAGSGKVFLYDDLSLVSNDTLSVLDTNLLHFNPYFIKTSLGIGDLNADSKPDFILGNARGGIYAYLGDTTNFSGINAISSYKNNGVLFPNPASNKIYINQVNKNDRIQILNAMGSEIQLQEKPQFKNGQFEMNISELASGFYFVYINSSATYKIAYRFIKE
jgi:Secretion system C-terminal sorting domain/FG-GAP-like repeat